MSYHKYINRRLLVFILTGAVLFLLSCDGISVATFYEHGAVATASSIASEVGLDILKQGGNAFDAAIAVAMTLAVTYPEAGNIGGGGFALLRDGTTGEITSLDFRETAPAAAGETMYLDEQGNPIEHLSTLGAKAVGVPGTVAGMYELWKQKGSMAWEDLVTIAAALADTGFIPDESIQQSLSEYRDQLQTFPYTGELFYPDGVMKKAGERFIQKDLARALYLIAAEGPDIFYTGEIADSIVRTMLDDGGLITLEDLAAYQPLWRDPLRFTFDTFTVYSMAPPSSGGIALGQILKLLEKYDMTGFTPNAPEYIHLFCEASRLAYADRSQYLGDPAFYTVPVKELLDSTYLATRREVIKTETAASLEEVQPGVIPGMAKEESDQTTHFSICDKDGNIVSMTYTLNTSYGSKLAVNGFGFLLNNEMDDFSIKPGVPNSYGLVGAAANKIEPGKRMLSSMSPTIVLSGDQPLAVIGTPGGSKIITMVAQAILAITRFNLSAEETVRQPRFHHQWLPDKLYFEEGGFSIDVKQTLIKYGHSVEERAPYGDMQILLIGESGLISGASDTRKYGAVRGY